MKNMVTKQEIQHNKDSPICAFTINPSKISRNKYKNILYNRVEIKKFKAVFTKRLIMKDLTTLPYGYDPAIHALKMYSIDTPTQNTQNKKS